MSSSSSAVVEPDSTSKFVALDRLLVSAEM